MMHRLTVLGAVAAMAAALTLLIGSSPARAAASFDVRIIHATKSKPYVHPSLHDIKRYLLRAFPRYNAFNLASRLVLTLKTRQRGDVRLPTGKSIALTFLGVKEREFIRYVFKWEGFRSIRRLRNRGIQFDALDNYKGGVLIFAVSVKIVKPRGEAPRRKRPPGASRPRPRKPK